MPTMATNEVDYVHVLSILTCTEYIMYIDILTMAPIFKSMDKFSRQKHKQKIIFYKKAVLQF